MSDECGSRPGWAEMLGNPDVHLDGEHAAVEAIRAWVGAAPATAGIFRANEPVLPADQYIYLEAVPSTTPEAAPPTTQETPHREAKS